MATQSATKNIITLRGSSQIVTEFFAFSINNILYQRGIYPPESFTRVQKYGLGMMVTKDEGLKNYLSQVLNQLTEWLLAKMVQKLCVVIASVDSGEVLERWTFDIVTDPNTTDENHAEKPEKEIMSEIQAIMRQITSCVSFLPLLDEPCSFDLLVYTDKETNVPKAWEESDPKYITKESTSVKLRSFTTKVHTVDAVVSYKAE